MKKMILFLIIGGVAVFCRFGLKYSGLLIDVGIFFVLIGFFMATEKIRPYIERLKEETKEAKKPTKEEETQGYAGLGV